MLAMNLEICLCFLSSSNLESYRCYLHRTWKLSRYTVKYNHDFQTSIASNHLNDKWGVSASNPIFSSCSSPPELTGPGGFLCYWTSGQLFSTDYFYPLPISKGCSVLNMHQAKPTDTGNRHVCFSVSLWKGPFYICPQTNGDTN